MSKIKKIMVVDDEAGIRNLLFEVLTEEGYQVTLAKDGQESLDKMKKQRFDLLITDINMPRVDGIELLKRMKQKGRKEKVIIMTGKFYDHSLEEEACPPVFIQLHKPFRVNQFVKIVCSALSPQRKQSRKIPMGLVGRGS